MWPNPQEPGNLVIFTEEVLNGKLYFLCSVEDKILQMYSKSIHLYSNESNLFNSLFPDGKNENLKACQREILLSILRYVLFLFVFSNIHVSIILKATGSRLPFLFYVSIF